MENPLVSVFSVKTDEEGQVRSMLATGFFMGIFMATYQVTAESLFISKLKDNHLAYYQLGNAILASGILGIASTALFSWAQNRMRFSVLAIMRILTVVLLSTGLYILYHVGSEEQH